MTQPLQAISNDNLQGLAGVSRLVTHIQTSAIDSTQTPIRTEEVPAVTNSVIERLIWGYPYLDQVVQEELDELRFRK